MKDPEPFGQTGLPPAAVGNLVVGPKRDTRQPRVEQLSDSEDSLISDVSGNECECSWWYERFASFV